MQLEETRPTTPEEHAPAEERLKGLHVLVGELLKANQELRFKVAFLEQQADSPRHDLARESARGLQSANL
jgi:hypothetical protein